MALVNLKSNLANFRSNFVTPGVEKKNAPEASKLNIDKIPTAYSGKTKFTVQYVDRNSIFNKDGINIKFSPNTKYVPTKYYPESIIKSTITRWSGNTPPAVNFIKDNTSNAKGFTINLGKTTSVLNSISGDKSQFISFVYTKQFSTYNTNFDQGTVSLTRQLGKGSPFPDFNGVTLNWAPKPHTGFFTKDKYEIAAKAVKDPSGDPNGFLRPSFERTGYTKVFTTKNSKFDQGIVSINRQLGKGSPFRDFIGPANWLPKPHTGFFDKNRYEDAVKAIILDGKSKQGFLAATFKPSGNLQSIDMDNSQFQMGRAKFLQQLGDGKLRLVKNYESGTVYDWFTPTSAFDKGVKNPHTGYHRDNLYVPRGIKFKGFLAATYNTNSPIDELYKKYNLQDAANSETSTGPVGSYIRQPFIERGIQRKGKESPQRWGIGNFDDGLIRGGITTAIERAAVDTARIAKWMASPRGLLWIVKQIGLGLTNPKVPAPAGRFGRATRIHTGVTALLSVAGTAFGLHFTRHGIPFVNKIADYENVVNRKYSRLEELNDEYGNPGKTFIIKSWSDLYGLAVSKGKTLITKSLGSATLSGLGGPNSVYGIGFTRIKRDVDTSQQGIYFDKNSYLHLYIGSLRAHTNNPYDVTEDSDRNTEINKLKKSVKGIDNPGQFITSYKKYQPSQDNSPEAFIRTQLASSRTQLSELPDITPNTGIETYKSKLSTYPAEAQNDKINNYLTLAYHKIPKSNKRRQFNDFRENIEQSANLNNVDKGLMGYKGRGYFENNNLEKKYGFGKLGEVGKDRSKPNEFIIPADGNAGSPFPTTFADLSFGNNTDRTRLSIKDEFRGDRITAINVVNDKVESREIYPETAKDLINFYFEDGNEGYNVMPFRCTMMGFTDNFSPGWDKIDIMGRPDGAYLYTSFERSISFSFLAAALSRSEMIPMWRKLNRLATYTMPDFDVKTGRPAGPFMRISIGNLFQRTPGFITSLTYTIPDDATWDIGEDITTTNKTPKQLPMMVEASVTFTIVNDYRPMLNGRVYSLEPLGGKPGESGDWIRDAKTTSPPISLPVIQTTNTSTTAANTISTVSTRGFSATDQTSRTLITRNNG